MTKQILKREQSLKIKGIQNFFMLEMGLKGNLNKEYTNLKE